MGTNPIAVDRNIGDALLDAIQSGYTVVIGPADRLTCRVSLERDGTVYQTNLALSFPNELSDVAFHNTLAALRHAHNNH